MTSFEILVSLTDRDGQGLVIANGIFWSQIPLAIDEHPVAGYVYDVVFYKHIYVVLISLH